MVDLMNFKKIIIYNKLNKYRWSKRPIAQSKKILVLYSVS